MKNFTSVLLLVSSLQAAAQPCIPNTNAIHFDGFSSYIDISPQTGLELTTAITLEAWINPDAFGFNSAQNSIVCKHGWSSGEGGFVLRCGGTGELSFNIAGVDTNNVNVSWIELISPANAISLNSWTHVAGTFDGYELKCYVNGSLAGSVSFQGTIETSSAYPLALGKLADPVWGPDRYFSGLMDEVRVWNRALSQAEIQSGMNNHLDPFAVTGLVSYWRLNEAAGSTIYDIAGTNNGTLFFCNWNNSVPFNAVPPTPVITYSNDTLYSSAPAGNQWYLDGLILNGATQGIYIPLQNGIYTVEVTSAEGCSTMSAPFTVIDVAVPELNNNLSAIIYPNPFREMAIVEFNAATLTGNAVLTISDISGRTVAEYRDVVISKPVTRVPIRRGNLCPGSYFYELRTADAWVAKGRLIAD